MRNLFRRSATVPEIHRRNFLHLYFDIAWFGVINGGFIAFSAVYLTRIGASTTQLGWFTAIPAVVALVLSLPVGYWLKNRKLGRTVFWSAIIFRSYYIVWLLLTLWLPMDRQINVVLLLTVVTGVPATLLSIGFNSLFSAIVPPEWRNHVIGIRHALMAIASVISTIVCGYVLETFPFPVGYQIVFGITIVAGIMGTIHLGLLDDRTKPDVPYDTGRPLRDPARPGLFATGSALRPPISWRFLRRREQLRLPSIAILRGDFGRAMAVVFFLFLALYLPSALYYPYWVDDLGYSDQLISFGSALFYICQFISAMQLAQVAKRFGNQKSLAIGSILLCAYPGLTAISIHPIAFLLSSAFSGIGWGIAGGAILSYVFDIIPEDKRPQYMAWYSLLTNMALLIGALLGPYLGEWLGLRGGLAVAGVIRLLSGVAVWIFGTVSLSSISASADTYVKLSPSSQMLKPSNSKSMEEPTHE